MDYKHMKEEMLLKKITKITVALTAIVFFLSAARELYVTEMGGTYVMAGTRKPVELEEVPVLDDKLETDTDETVLISPEPVIIFSDETENTKEEEQQVNVWEEFASTDTETIETKGTTVYDMLFGDVAERIMNVAGERCIVIKKPANSMFSVTEDLLTRTIKVSAEYVKDKNDLSPADVYRIDGEKSLNGGWNEVSYDLVENMSMTFSQENRTADILMVTKEHWCFRTYNIGGYYVISLKRPKEIYDRIVVIDAGHGGKDPGAPGCDGKTWEDDINLDIVLHLKELLDNDPDIKAFYTRTASTYPSLDDRVALANGVDADLFISVHCNASTSKEGNGTEALYSTTQGLGNGFNSESLARLCVANLASALGTKLRGIVSGDDIRIIRNSKVPVTLLEVCFISNKNDLKLIKDENNRKNAAKAIYDSIHAAYEYLEKGN